MAAVPPAKVVNSFPRKDVAMLARGEAVPEASVLNAVYPLTKGVVVNVFTALRRNAADDAYVPAPAEMRAAVGTLCALPSLTDDEAAQMVRDAQALSADMHLYDGRALAVMRVEPYVAGDTAPSEAYLQARQQYRALTKRRWQSSEGGPMDALALSTDFRALLDKPRRRCASCGRSCHLYCHACCAWVETTVRPRALELPAHVHLMYHSVENRSKSTGLHAKTLAGDRVSVHVVDDNTAPAAYPVFDPATTVLVYPVADAVSIDALPHPDRVENVVVVESTWQKAKNVVKSPALAHLPRVRLAEYETAYWRTQTFGGGHLATIEAIYYALRELVEAQRGAAYDGSFDDLLLIYAAWWHRVDSNKRPPKQWALHKKKPKLTEEEEEEEEEKE